ncbi:MAG: hypothetical protein LAO20_18340 [Acidobacteriia bacterium]|nr:hypothetical protein [Terriglobia bacterium]
MKRCIPLSFAVVFAAGVFFAYALPASAQQAGYDLLQTPSGASIGVPGVSPSTVELQGVPICACTGPADTIMHRSANIGGHASLTVVALFLKNSIPVTRGGSNVDVYITVNNSDGVIGQSVLPQPDALPASTGSLTIRANGTFDSSFIVHADIIIVPAGADVRNPATHLAHMAAAPVTLGASNNVWSALPPAGYPPECFFPANGFYPGGPVPETAPTGPHQHPVVPPGPPGRADGAHCVYFNPATTAKQMVSGRWKVVDGGHILFDFDSRESDAQRTVDIIKHFNMNETCTVGTNLPGELMPPMQFELVGGAAPTGTLPGGGEDCIPDNLAAVTVLDENGFFTIVDDRQRMFYFLKQKTAADQGAAIIKHYAFNQLCFVGRPDTGGRYVFVYMKAGPAIHFTGPFRKDMELKKLPPIGPGPVEKEIERPKEIVRPK